MIEYKSDKNKLTILFSGDFLRFPGENVSRLIQKIKKSACKNVMLTDAGIGRWDSSLTVFLFRLIRDLPPDIKINTKLPIGLTRLLDLAFAVRNTPVTQTEPSMDFLTRLGDIGLRLWQSLWNGLCFLKDVCGSFRRLLQRRAFFRAKDFWLIMDDCAPKAVGIVSLISFMVGLILAFVGAIQLKSFGAQIYVSSLVMIGMTRIMGAVMTGVIMAGRTGASFAATLGSMQAGEELDALKTMGVSRTDFLILPRILALVITMPILTLLADFIGVIGGATVGVFLLDISAQEYIRFSLEALDWTNFWVGIFHGFIFGIVIALCGCYFGIHSGRDANSVGQATTKAVVFSIVWMIVMTGIITLICEVIGL